MNDRYLYRAKRKDNGEWIVGSLIQAPYLGSIRSWISSEQEDKARLREISSNQAVWRAFEVRTDTICQCTGLKDKNGKLIFENDIVRICDYIVKVLWCDEFALYRLDTKNFKFSYFFGETFKAEDVEIIGNIFDNPELLEQKGCD